jgi:hypothetical protein
MKLNPANKDLPAGALTSLHLFPFLGTNPLVASSLHYSVRQSSYYSVRHQLGLQRDSVRTFFFRRGYLSLLEGDIEGARARFEKVRQPAVPDWNLPEQTMPAAGLYLGFIEDARKKK